VDALGKSLDRLTLLEEISGGEVVVKLDELTALRKVFLDLAAEEAAGQITESTNTGDRERFANGLHKEGSMSLPGDINRILEKYALRAQDSFASRADRAGRALNAKYGQAWGNSPNPCYIQAMFPDKFVYDLGGQSYLADYTDDGVVCTIKGEPVKVAVTYTPIP
jgi:hypothetical protein